MLEQALMISGASCSLEVAYRNVMSVIVPEYSVKQGGGGLSYGLATSPGSLDIALEKFSQLISRLIKLAADEKALKLMASEIERTRRRVNALEHVMIPSFKETIRDITMKLDEMERSSQSRLMVIKEIVRSH
jgi:V/A-type H+-transporting ATPase subunit D